MVSSIGKFPPAASVAVPPFPLLHAPSKITASSSVVARSQALVFFNLIEFPASFHAGVVSNACTLTPPVGVYNGVRHEFLRLNLQAPPKYTDDMSKTHEHHGHEAAKAETRADAIKRLSYIEGHLAGVKKMVDEERYCVDILRQTFAVRRAIQKLESQLIDGHLRTCVVEGVKEGREEQILSELVELYEIADR